jgi:hypothetical protein
MGTARNTQWRSIPRFVCDSLSSLIGILWLLTHLLRDSVMQLLVFDAIEHKVLFVTLPLLEQLGYPTHTEQQKYDSEMHDSSFVPTIPFSLFCLPHSPFSKTLKPDTLLQRFRSSVRSHSFVDQLILPNARDTDRLQENVRTVVADQRAYSARGGLRQSPSAGKANRGAFVDENGTRFSMSLIHITPMKNREGGEFLFYPSSRVVPSRSTRC